MSVCAAKSLSKPFTKSVETSGCVINPMRKCVEITIALFREIKNDLGFRFFVMAYNMWPFV